jgi:class 3 adenylate cyclase
VAVKCDRCHTVPYTPAVTGRWVTHALIYLSTCSTLSLVWVLLGGGTVDELKDYARTPGHALNLAFWPVWFWLLWGTAVTFHLAVVVGRGVPALSRRRRAGADEALVSPARRHVVAMFTDLTGSTTANERLGDDAWAALLADHRQVVRELVAAHGGTEVNTQGDGFFVRFDHPASATACAEALQSRCQAQRTGGSDLPAVRIGIHRGDAVHEDHDVLGQVVNVAARLLEVAGPNEILVTESVADVIGPDRLEDRGLVALKGLSQPRHVLALRWDPETPAAEPLAARTAEARDGPRRRGRRLVRPRPWRGTH